MLSAGEEEAWLGTKNGPLRDNISQALLDYRLWWKPYINVIVCEGKIKETSESKAQSADCAGSGPETTPLRA